jgi:anti-sigma factor RsiW
VNCNELVELITDYLDGAMAPLERERVDQHLATCAGCTAYLEQFRATIRLTGMLTEEQIPPHAREELRTVFHGWRSTLA